MSSSDAIIVKGAKTHNLKGIDCRFPHHQLTVVTGVSGSGKSSLAFDTVFVEGQWRYLQTVSPYARQFLDQARRPPVESIHNIPPTLALRQHQRSLAAQSTVGLMTELDHYLGLLFVALGEIVCHKCGQPVRPDTPFSVIEDLRAKGGGKRAVIWVNVPFGDEPSVTRDELLRTGFTRILIDRQIHRSDEISANQLGALDTLAVVIDRPTLSEHSARLSDSIETGLELGKGCLHVSLLDEELSWKYHSDLTCNQCDIRYIAPSLPLFRFDSALGACERCQGTGRQMGLTLPAVFPNPWRSVAGGVVAPFLGRRGRLFQMGLESACRRHGISIDAPFDTLSAEQRRLIVDGDGTFQGVRGFFRVLERDSNKPEIQTLLNRYQELTKCDDCEGTGLSKMARAVKMGGMDLSSVNALTIEELVAFLDGLALPPPEAESVETVLAEISTRLATLSRLGLGYLSLARKVPTLSLGETQRIMLAACIGRDLSNTCYILDEPTIGLHARDSRRLLEVLRSICRQRNTVIVVEHDLDIIGSADHVVELGPTGGEQGGHLLFEGDPAALCQMDTATAHALMEVAPSGTSSPGESGILVDSGIPDQSDIPGQSDYPAVAGSSDDSHSTSAFAREHEDGWLVIKGARAHNLKNIEATFPVGCLTAVTGVSGSGKSTLVFDVLQKGLNSLLIKGQPVEEHLCESITGARLVSSVVAIKQRPIGLTARSNVSTFCGVHEPLRNMLAETPDARALGLTAFHFSTNVTGGRCERCQGLGVKRIDMHFMPDIDVPCDDCSGTGFHSRVLEVALLGHNIVDILGMTVDQALTVFSDCIEVTSILRPVAEVGLGYLRLGQPSQTLSGGEVQRLTISKFLAASRVSATRPASLFLFDEPSIGLHRADVRCLVEVLGRLRSEGHTIVVVEHNLHIIDQADWVVDLGPEAGDEGGQIVVMGTPEEVRGCESSITGRYLRKMMHLTGTGSH